MSTRTIKSFHTPVRDDIGELLTFRALPTHSIQHIDPFLFLNHHGYQVYEPHNNGLPFGPHPHRGFSTVTFVLKGDIAHHDSKGHESIINAGGIQWMTAGSGLIHSEVSSEEFKKNGGEIEILQLWVNLPSHLKMTKPHYVGLQRNEIPTIQTPKDQSGGKMNVHLVAGTWGEAGQIIRGPIDALTDIHLMTLEFSTDCKQRLSVPKERSIFFYIVNGEVEVNGQFIAGPRLVEFNQDGSEIDVRTKSNGVIIFGHATPYNEPIASHGPFVMNTREEIIQAIQDYQSGKFN